jgi:hypothetical protein
MPRQLIGGTGGGAGSGGGSREEEILAVIDKGAEAFVFPMLDNGYVYLAGARLSLHRSAEDWALVFEIFGFSPRSEAPDVGVFSFGSRLKHGHTRADFVDESAYQRFLAVHPHDASEFFFPLDGDWQEDDDLEWVSSTASTVIVRGREIAMPPREAYSSVGITLEDPKRVATFELCRYLAAVDREDVLATPHERRTHVQPELAEILVLDDWHHPDLVKGELPSQTAAFRSIAEVLSTGEVHAYNASEAPNTHWSNWPEGGRL